MTNEPVHVLLDVTVKDRVKFLEYVEGQKPPCSSTEASCCFEATISK